MRQPLAGLLNGLRRCVPSERITFREPILQYGPAAVPALRDLARTDPALGPSVVSWLEVLAKREPALRGSVLGVLRGLATDDRSETGRYADQAWTRLGMRHLTGPHSSTPRPASVSRTGGTDWAGFQAHEFGRNAGTTWRSTTGRTSLAPILTRVLHEFDPGFRSFGVDRSPEIHFALARRYRGSKAASITASKLVVYAHGPTLERPGVPAQVVAGWYIEKGDGRAPYGSPDDPAAWDWPLFLAALTRGHFRLALTAAMERHDLVLGDYAGGRFTPSVGWTARIEHGDPVARQAGNLPVARGWPAIYSWLTAVPADTWLDLHLWRTWPAAEAMSAGQPFALRELAPVFTDLAELYLDVVGRS